MIRSATAGAIAIALALISGCSDKGAANLAMRPPVPVLVAKAVQRDVPDQIKEIGTVEAFAAVAIKARVEGNLERINFKEGEFVKEGQTLAVLDARPFAAALAQAQANLTRDQANADKAHTDEQRFAFLLKEGVGSRQQYDQAYADSKSLAATVAADRAAVETARLNLQYTQIKAPLDGRTGNLGAHLGDLIKADADNPIVTIDQIQPIYVAFSIAENRLAEVRRNMATRQLEVDATIPGDPGPAEHGVLAFVDNAVDKTTGTIELKGLFQNENRRLWPGQFVNATLTLNETPKAILIPSQAIQNGQQGTFVYVVGADLKVAQRPVVAGAVFDNETVIVKGIAAGETVITDGQLLLTPGATVRVKSALGSGGLAS
jgi:membrane fusion protein, multidrug efflux system